MSNKIWDDKSTDLTLNGPKVAISADTSATVSYTHLTLPTNREV